MQLRSPKWILEVTGNRAKEYVNRTDPLLVTWRKRAKDARLREWGKTTFIAVDQTLVSRSECCEIRVSTSASDLQTCRCARNKLHRPLCPETIGECAPTKS